MHSEQQVVSGDTADVCSQTVPDAGGPGDGHALFPQERHQLRDTLADRLHVVDGGRVAGDLCQPTPVHDEHVVAAVGQIRCNRHKQILHNLLKEISLKTTLLYFHIFQFPNMQYLQNALINLLTNNNLLIGNEH